MFAGSLNWTLNTEIRLPSLCKERRKDRTKLNDNFKDNNPRPQFPTSLTWEGGSHCTCTPLRTCTTKWHQQRSTWHTEMQGVNGTTTTLPSSVVQLSTTGWDVSKQLIDGLSLQIEIGRKWRVLSSGSIMRLYSRNGSSNVMYACAWNWTLSYNMHEFIYQLDPHVCPARPSSWSICYESDLNFWRTSGLYVHMLLELVCCS